MNFEIKTLHWIERSILTGIAFIALLTIQSCGDDGIKIFDKDVNLSRSFDIDVPAHAPLMTVTLRNTFDATADPEIKKVVETIDRYTVNSVSYSIDNYSGEPAILEEGIIKVKSIDGDVLGSVTLSNVDLQSINGAGKQALPFDNSEVAKVEQVLKEDNKLELEFTATLDNKPVAFTLTSYIDLNVEYRVFD